MDTTLNDLLSDEGLLFFEEERVTCYGKSSYVQGMGTIGWPWSTEVVGDILGALRWSIAGLCHSRCIGDDLGRTSIMSLKAVRRLALILRLFTSWYLQGLVSVSVLSHVDDGVVFFGWAI